MLFSHSRKGLALLLVMLAIGAVMTDTADARRGGSFGSRGTRTYQAPAATNTLPGQTAPLNRSMTQRPQPAPQAAGAAQQASRPGLFGGMAGGLLGGLMLGGLIGMLTGNGLGGMSGFLGLLLQGGILILLASLAMRYFRSRQNPMAAGNAPSTRDAMSGLAERFGIGGESGGPASSPAHSAPHEQGDEIGITAEDLDAFERLLTEVQTAFGAEDFATLRSLTTPEIMSYLSEELGQNAARGLRNEVSEVKLLQGDVAEAWSEGPDDYATVALRYSSKDALIERESGRVVNGSRDAVTETGELWTFVRDQSGEWKLSAIQEA